LRLVLLLLDLERVSCHSELTKCFERGSAQGLQRMGLGLQPSSMCRPQNWLLPLELAATEEAGPTRQVRHRAIANLKSEPQLAKSRAAKSLPECAIKMRTFDSESMRLLSLLSEALLP